MICAFLLLALLGCERKDKEKLEVMNLSLAPPPAAKMVAPPQQDAASPGANDVAKKIIKEGNIGFETKNINATRNAIYNSLQKLGGYIAEETETNNGDNNRKEYTIRARVPAKNFDLFLTDVAANAEAIDTKNIRIKDVTTQYIDITTQLANKKKLEDRYLELLKKAGKMSDLLEIENKLNEIRTSIETTQGELNYLIKQIDYSSLEITFYSKQLVKDNGQTFGYKLKTAIIDGWNMTGIIFFGIIGVWPLWIVIAILFYIIKTARRRARERKEKAIPNKKPE